LNDYSDNNLFLKLVDDFLASHYFVGISMKSSTCLLNLRKILDGGLTSPFFGSFDME